ncbi:hypothetical protein RRG08_034367 [Elysia crispata]|uniref:Secreted protein n=1 Tax=Elysia crispata TaxID=231223 RepID=A0AAE0YDR5_9GAST|nr:hypothetical protein RRG08_034367 [Elysia crispata]
MLVRLLLNALVKSIRTIGCCRKESQKQGYAQAAARQTQCLSSSNGHEVLTPTTLDTGDCWTARTIDRWPVFSSLYLWSASRLRCRLHSSCPLIPLSLSF